MRKIAALLLFLALPAFAGLPAYDSQGEALPSLAPMLKKTIPAVVNVVTRTRVAVEQNPLLADPFFRHFFDIPAQPRERTEQSLGSGVVVDADRGYIITNHHVIDGAHEISINLSDGRTLQAELVGTDPETDIAVLKVAGDKLSAITLGDSERLEVGDFVVAIGNPFGLGQTVTSGIVSAMGRSGLGIEGYEDFIQTDASINPGNSGGALVNLRGELVGLNTAILSKSGGNVGIGFAIPIHMVREVMAQLIEKGAVERGSLGATAQDLTPELAAAFGIHGNRGAVVTQVNRGSPAERAGLRPGDVIIELDGRRIDDASDVRNRIGLLRVGQVVRMRVIRNGEELGLKAEIETPQVTAIKGEKVNEHLAGATLGNIVEGMDLYGRIEGVVVLDVAGGSPARAAGLHRGDVIAQANRHPVEDIDTLVAATEGSSALLLNIVRRDGAFYLLLQ